MTTMPSNLDEFLPVLSTTDTKIKLSIGTKLHAYLRDPTNSIECSDIGRFIDSLVIWLQSSNYKVAQNSLEILTELVLRMKNDFQTYLPSVLSYIVDKLGDSKETIREKSFVLLKKLIEYDVTSAQQLFDRISNGAFQHKNSNVREQIMVFLTCLLDEYGSQILHVSKLVPSIVRLLSDPNASVRSTAFQTLVNIYKHVGDRLRLDLQRKYSIPQNKLPLLMQAFDDLANNKSEYDRGSNLKSSDDLYYPTLQPQNIINNNNNNNNKDDQTTVDGVIKTIRTNIDILPPLCPSLVTPPMFKTTSSSTRKLISSSASNNNNNNNNNNNTNNTNSHHHTGGMDEEIFAAAFEDVPSMRIYGGKEVEEFLKKTCTVIDNVNSDWSKRVELLKSIRSLILAGATNYDEFHLNFHLLLPAFHSAIKDLRSQVVREACITIAFLSKNLTTASGGKFDHFAESLLMNLIQLIQNSAKIMASSGLVCIHFILKYTHNARLIPIIDTNMKSKSKDIRRACSEFIYVILRSWNVSIIERHMSLVQDVIKRGVADADQEARTYSRKSYWLFSEHFPDKAEQLLNSLDGSYRKLLTSYGLSSSSSSATGDHQSYHDKQQQQHSVTKKAITPLINRNNNDFTSSCVKVKPSPRSSSAVDLQAAKRAKVRAQYAALARNKIAALPKSAVNVKRSVTPSKDQTLERAARTRNRMSISQPTSRSSSPSSKFSYNTNTNIYGTSNNTNYHHHHHHHHNISSSTSNNNSPLCSTLNRSQRCLQTPKSRSTNTSREPSPNRFHTSSSLKGNSPSRIPTQPIYKPVIAQKILQQSQEAESALADALGHPTINNNWLLTNVDFNNSNNKLNFRRLFRSLEDHSDESETSSICSDHSFDFPRNNSKSFDSHSWSNDSTHTTHWLQQQQQQQQHCSNSPFDWKSSTKIVNDIVALCKSGYWNERKEGLIAMQYYLDSGCTIEPNDLKTAMEVFIKIFNDPHTKVFGLYLDALNKLIVSHHNNLHFCLRLLLTRLLNKLGTDLLSSVQSKIMKTLHTVLVTFPADLQMRSIFQFLVDPTQTPNAQVKIAALNYIAKLTYMTDPSLVFSSSNNNNNTNNNNNNNNGNDYSVTNTNKKDHADLAFMKIVDWIVGGDDGIKSRADVRKAAEDCIIALFNLNTPEVTFKFSALSYEKQQKITDLIKTKLNTADNDTANYCRFENDINNAGSNWLSSPSSFTSKKPVRNGSITSHHLSSLSSSADVDNKLILDDNRSLCVVDSSSEAGDNCINNHNNNINNIDASLKKLTLAIRDTLSLDVDSSNDGSLSKFNSSNGTVLATAVDNKGGRNLSPSNTSATTTTTTPTVINSNADNNNRDEEILKKLLDNLTNESIVDNDNNDNNNNNNNDDDDHRKKQNFLTQLEKILPEITSEVIVKHFRMLLRLILALISSEQRESAAVKESALRILQLLVTRQTITYCFNDYIELILLKVMNVSRDNNHRHTTNDKDIGRAVENCAVVLSTYLPVEYTMRVVVPLITSDDYPINLLAIKMLTRLAERSKQIIADNVQHIMPSLLTAYDNSDSCVRKSSVFCMVALHAQLGEDTLAPYINTLSTAKIKLLRLYIDKAQKGSINV